VAIVNSEKIQIDMPVIMSGDNFRQEPVVEELLKNINILDGLKKRLSFTLREIDVSINKR
jgi:hypothetical protein